MSESILPIANRLRHGSLFRFRGQLAPGNLSGGAPLLLPSCWFLVPLKPVPSHLRGLFDPPSHFRLCSPTGTRDPEFPPRTRKTTFPRFQQLQNLDARWIVCKASLPVVQLLFRLRLKLRTARSVTACLQGALYYTARHDSSWACRNALTSPAVWVRGNAALQPPSLVPPRAYFTSLLQDAGEACFSAVREVTVLHVSLSNYQLCAVL